MSPRVVFALLALLCVAIVVPIPRPGPYPGLWLGVAVVFALLANAYRPEVRP